MRALMLTLALLAGPAAAAAEPPATLITVNPVVLHEVALDKDVALRVTVPEKGGKLPIILFSHGAQYSKDDYLPLTEFWAAHGYAVIQPTHIESLALGLPRDDARVQAAWRSRVLDMRFILDSLGEIARKAPVLKGRFDASKVIAAGHSFGGHTTAALAGASMPDEKADLSDPRITAAIMLAPPGLSPGFRNVAWPNRPKPMLLIVGQDDIIKGFNDTWEAHADYYFKGPTDQCLAAMSGMKHYLGGILGTHRTEEQTPNPDSLAEIQRMTLAFLETETKGKADWTTLRAELLKQRPASVGVFSCK